MECSGTEGQGSDRPAAGRRVYAKFGGKGDILHYCQGRQRVNFLQGPLFYNYSLLCRDASQPLNYWPNEEEYSTLII